MTLVIALEIESYLKHPDFSASERLFQSLLQVSGRAGRHPQQSKKHQEPVFIMEVSDPDSNFLKDLSTANYVDFAEVRIPYACKLLMQELESMSMAPRFITQ